MRLCRGPVISEFKFPSYFCCRSSGLMFTTIVASSCRNESSHHELALHPMTCVMNLNTLHARLKTIRWCDPTTTFMQVNIEKVPVTYSPHPSDNILPRLDIQSWSNTKIQRRTLSSSLWGNHATCEFHSLTSNRKKFVKKYLRVSSSHASRNVDWINKGEWPLLAANPCRDSMIMVSFKGIDRERIKGDDVNADNSPTVSVESTAPSRLSSVMFDQEFLCIWDAMNF